MFERWVGAPTFQKGVQRYMREHAYGSATASDFIGAIATESGKDIGKAFSSFLDQPGVPLVSATLQCDANAPKLALRQARYLPQGSAGKPAPSTWKTPVCVRYGAHEKVERACTLLDGDQGELPV